MVRFLDVHRDSKNTRLYTRLSSHPQAHNIAEGLLRCDYEKRDFFQYKMLSRLVLVEKGAQSVMYEKDAAG